MKINKILKNKKCLILLGAILLVVLIIIFSIIKVNNTTFADYIIKLSTSDNENMIKDDYGNIRYVGANPNNYVLFNNELWRIIGVFDGKVKLIRNESIGSFSWDVSDDDINNGLGISEWSQADLMYELNSDYLDTSLKESKLWSCTDDTECLFDSVLKLSDESQQLISKNIWNTGRIYWNYYDESNPDNNPLNLSAKEIYELEINDVEHKLDFKNESDFNDDVVRKTSWTGLVGLPSVSDIVYSSSENCSLYKIRENVADSSLSHHCYDNNWMVNGITESYWTLNTFEFDFKNVDMKSLNTSAGEGIINFYLYYQSVPVTNANAISAVRPTVFLIDSVKLDTGNGSIDNPFILKVDSKENKSESNYELLTEHIKRESTKNSYSFYQDNNDIRYIGPSPNNYVRFNNEIWRIIGIVDGKVKMIRNSDIGSYAIPTSDYKYTLTKLNTDYLDVSLVSNPEWCITDNEDNCYNLKFDISRRLSKESQKYITNGDFYLGAIDSDDYNVHEIYELEHGIFENYCKESNNFCNYKKTEKYKFTGKVGLASLSDYMYAAGDSIFNLSELLSIMKSNNWMHYYGSFMTLFKNNDQVNAISIYSGYNGDDFSTDYYYYFIRPVVYLDKSVKVDIKNSDGSINKPYVLFLDDEANNSNEDIKKDDYNIDEHFSKDKNITDNNKQNVDITNEEYDVSMFEELTTDEAISKIKKRNKVVLYIGRPTCEYCVQFLPTLQKAQEEFGYKTIYVDLEKIIASGDQDKWGEFGGVLGTYIETCEAAEDIEPVLKCGKFGTTPMIVIFENGEIKDDVIGYVEYDAFTSFLQNNGFIKRG